MDLSALPLAHVLVVTPSHSGVHPMTRKCIAQLEELGAGRLDLSGCSDVALARNLVLTHALHSPEQRTMFLLVDADMQFTTGQAQLVVEQAEGSEHPVSACYATSSASLAHTRRPDGRWNSGLGFMAVRRDKLQALADTLPAIPSVNREPIHPFCQCRPSEDGKTWLSEDYWFCNALGGVAVASIGVAHLKEMPISPDQYTLDHLNDVPDTADTERPAAE